MPWWFYVLAVLWGLPLLFVLAVIVQAYRRDRRAIRALREAEAAEIRDMERAMTKLRPAHLGVNFRAVEDEPWDGARAHSEGCDGELPLPSGMATQRLNPRRTGR